MRLNEPVTQKESEFKEGDVLVSTTDAGGRLTDANDAFVEISGYTKEELMGEPHNIVRHPDMPQEAFRDLWADLKDGKPWSGYVKNRCKNGDFYWVLASVTPLLNETGEIKGYMSVRSKPARDMVAAVGALYKDFREGKAGSKTILHGRVVENGLKDRLLRRAGTIKGRVAGIAILLCVLIALTAGTSAYFGKQTKESLRTVYADRTVAAGQLSAISNLMYKNMNNLQSMIFADDVWTKELVADVEKNRDEITKTWKEYMATYLTPEEKELADSYGALRKTFVVQGLNAGMEIAKSGDVAAQENHVKNVALPEFHAASAVAEKLLALQLRVAGEEYSKGNANYMTGTKISIGVLVLAILAAAVSSMILSRHVLVRLSYLKECLNSIAGGNLSTPIDVEEDEVGEVLTVLRGMQSKLYFAEYQKIDAERMAKEQRRQEMNEMADKFEQDVGNIIVGVSSAAEEMQATAGTMSGTANDTSQRATTVAGGSQCAVCCNGCGTIISFYF